MRCNTKKECVRANRDSREWTTALNLTLFTGQETNA